MKFQISNHKSQTGFTLIEALVSASVFAFVVSGILGVYMSTLRLDTRTRAQRSVSDNARFIMEFLAKEVRDGRIDYSAAACGSVVTNTTQLCLVNQSNEAVRIYAQDPGNISTGTDLVIAKAAGTTNLNSSNVKITKLKFAVSPTVDPLTSARAANEQPRVTVVLELTAQSARDPVKVNLQTTLSENYYPSRQ